MNKSVATINAPRFINLSPLDINPLMSKCEIKVLYLGENRNHSFLTEDVVTEMAKTLRGAPIVGYYKEEKEDFADHGEVVIIDDEGIKFECRTQPYGFVSPDAQVWFQEFEDTNEFGEKIIRDYLMTTGYLWTGQFEECKSAVEGEGKPHSMELDEETLQGRWEKNTRGIEFFIINDAIFSKLCILGDDVEPCFEGSSVKAPDVSASFAKVDSTFRQTLFTMMQELKTALKGDQQMDDNTIVTLDPVIEQEPAPAEPAVDPVDPVVEPVAPVEDPDAASDPIPAVDPEPEVQPEGEPAPEPVVAPEPEVEPIVEPEPAADPAPSEFEILQGQFTELQNQFTELTHKYEEATNTIATLQTENEQLIAFKAEVEDARKDQMIESFYMLSDEDKQAIIASKSQFTVEEIEEKLSVLCFRKGNFNLTDSSKNNNKVEEQPIVTFDFKGSTGSSKPAWVSAMDNRK